MRHRRLWSPVVCLVAGLCLVTAVRAAAGPRPTTTAATKYRLGYSAGDMAGMSPARLAARIHELKAAHADWVRFDVYWDAVQRGGPSSWDWSTYDPVVAALDRAGLHSIVVLSGSPPWARQPGCGTRTCMPADPGRFAAMAAAAVRRYAPRGLHVWEVWNEPNLRAALAGDDRVRYPKVLEAASRAIRRADRGATVLVGGLAPTTVAEGGVPAAVFIREIADTDAYDGVAMHPYSYPALPDDREQWTGWHQMLRLRQQLVASGQNQKKIWITEFGAPTAGPGQQARLADRRYSAHPDHVDTALQSASAQQFTYFVMRTPWVGAGIWYGFQDLGYMGTAAEGHFGVLTTDARHKPAYDVLTRTFGTPVGS